MDKRAERIADLKQTLKDMRLDYRARRKLILDELLKLAKNDG